MNLSCKNKQALNVHHCIVIAAYYFIIYYYILAVTREYVAGVLIINLVL